MTDRLTKFNEETGRYEFHEVAKTQAEFNAQRKAVIQRLGEFEDKATDVAEEIFAEIEKKIDLELSIIRKIIHAKGGRANGKTILLGKIQMLIDLKNFIAELKKKYTQGKAEIPPYVRMGAKALPAILNVKYTESEKDNG